jgi:hypothetical protein
MSRRRNLAPSHRKPLEKIGLDLGEKAVVVEDLFNVLERAERK